MDLPPPYTNSSTPSGTSGVASSSTSAFRDEKASRVRDEARHRKLVAMLGTEGDRPHTILCPTCLAFHPVQSTDSSSLSQLYSSKLGYHSPPITRTFANVPNFKIRSRPTCASLTPAWAVKGCMILSWANIYLLMKAYRRDQNLATVNSCLEQRLAWQELVKGTKREHGWRSIRTQARVTSGHLILKVKYSVERTGSTATNRLDAEKTLAPAMCIHNREWADHSNTRYRLTGPLREQFTRAIDQYIESLTSFSRTSFSGSTEEVHVGKCDRCPTEYVYRIYGTTLVVERYSDIGMGLPTELKEWKALTSHDLKDAYSEGSPLKKWNGETESASLEDVD